MSEYFHVAPILLEPGSIIEPGNYGRIVRRFGKQHNRWLHENVLEDFRRRHHAMKPSRLSSAFACQTLLAAQRFMDQNLKTGVIYRVRFQDAAAAQHIACFHLISPVGHLSGVDEWCDAYWTGAVPDWIDPDQRNDLEIFSESPMEVIERGGEA